MAGIVLKVRNRFALIPGGGSNTNTREARTKFTGTCFRKNKIHYHCCKVQRLSLPFTHHLTKIKLTITKKMADVHFTRMHSGRNSVKKGNGRLLKDRLKAGG